MSNGDPRLKASDGTSNLSASQRRSIQGLQQGELNIVRKKAENWAKGLAGVLAVTFGFSLITGPSDISALQRGYGIAVGAAVALALLTGVVATLLLLRAAFGKTANTQMYSEDVNEAIVREVRKSVNALNSGLVFGIFSLAFITAAVGVTWYAPREDALQINVILQSGVPVCGQSERTADGKLELKTSNGIVAVDLNQIIGMRPVDRCPSF